jgi:hypothetical protein
MRICPAADPADPADGAFDVTVVGPVSRRELVRTRPRLTAGTHVEPPAVTVHRARRVELAGEGLRTHADGEPVAHAAGRQRVRARRAVGGGHRPLSGALTTSWGIPGEPSRHSAVIPNTCADGVGRAERRRRA